MPETFPLALVTGGARRIGKALALSLARQGYALILHYDQSVAEASATAAQIRALGVPVYALQADLSDEDQITRLFSEVDETSAGQGSLLGPLSVLVNSAARMQRGAAGSQSAADFDATLDLNLRAPFLCAQHAYRRMSSGGLIVNLSDVGARQAWTGYPVYAASKAALESLTRSMARSFAPGVRVNAIAPGLVLPADDMPAADWQRLVERLPLKRPASLVEIASSLEFLLKNEYITGQTIVVDGGYSLL